MILPVVLIALMLCTGNEAMRRISECQSWACFTSKKCLNTNKFELAKIDENRDVFEDCSVILMIRPYTNKRWRVVLESWNPSVTELKLLQHSTELFSCKKEGFKSEASSHIPGLEKLQPYSDQKISCQFMIGDETAEIYSTAVNVKLVTKARPDVESNMNIGEFSTEIFTKTHCNVGRVLFGNSTSSEEATEPTHVGLDSVVCTTPDFKLQYKTVSGYVDAVGTGITCVKDASGSNYHYQIETIQEKTFPTGSFYARCYSPVCSLCTYLPKTANGKVAPTILKDEHSNCTKLACPYNKKYFTIDGEASEEKEVCTKIANDQFKWKVGGRIVENTTQVECSNQKKCLESFSGCSGDCKLNTTTGRPFCEDTYKLFAFVNSDWRPIEEIACNNDTGVLFYSGKDATPVLAFYRQAWFGPAFNSALGVTALITAGLIAYTVRTFLQYKRQRAQLAKAAVKP